MSMDWGHLPWFWGLGMLVGMGAVFLLWALILAALILLVRWLWFQRGPAARGEDSALEILRRRYARGEITREEFENMRRDLLA